MGKHEFGEQIILGVAIGVLVALVRWLGETPEQQWQLLGLAALAITAVQALLLARGRRHSPPPSGERAEWRWRNNPFARESSQGWTGLVPTGEPEHAADRRERPQRHAL